MGAKMAQMGAKMALQERSWRTIGALQLRLPPIALLSAIGAQNGLTVSSQWALRGAFGSHLGRAR